MADILEKITGLIDRAGQVDDDGTLRDLLRQLRRDYKDVLEDRWSPSADRAREYFGETLAAIRGIAREAGADDIAETVESIENEICQSIERRP